MKNKCINFERKLSGLTLKIVACTTMCIDHIGAIILEKYILTSKSVETLYILFRLIGRVSFPIYCFLLAEGFRHTSNKMKYLFRMALFAGVSEIPYDIAFHGQMVNWAGQNIFFTLALGLLTLCILEEIACRNMGRSLRLICSALTIILVGAFNARLLHGAYGFFGICTIAMAFLFTKKEDAYMAECFTLTAMSYPEVTSLLALPLIHMYSGEREKSTKWASYVFYPVHLLTLKFISQLIR